MSRTRHATQLTSPFKTRKKATQPIRKRHSVRWRPDLDAQSPPLISDPRAFVIEARTTISVARSLGRHLRFSYVARTHLVLPRHEADAQDQTSFPSSSRVDAGVQRLSEMTIRDQRR